MPLALLYTKSIPFRSFLSKFSHSLGASSQTQSRNPVCVATLLLANHLPSTTTKAGVVSCLLRQGQRPGKVVRASIGASCGSDACVGPSPCGHLCTRTFGRPPRGNVSSSSLQLHCVSEWIENQLGGNFTMLRVRKGYLLSRERSDGCATCSR